MPELRKAPDLYRAIEEELKYQMRPAAAPESLWPRIEGARRNGGGAVRQKRTIAMGLVLAPCAALMLVVLFAGNLRSTDPARAPEWNRTAASAVLSTAALQDTRCALCHIQ